MRTLSIKFMAISVGLFALVTGPILNAAQSVMIAGWDEGKEAAYVHSDFSVGDIVVTGDASGERTGRGSNDGTWGDDTGTLSLTVGGAVQNPATTVGSAIYQNNGSLTFSITNNSSSKYIIEMLNFDWQANGDLGHTELLLNGIKHDLVSSTSPLASATYSDYADASLAFKGISAIVNPGDSLTFTLNSNGGTAMDIDNIAVVGRVYTRRVYAGTPVLICGWAEDGLLPTFGHANFAVDVLKGADSRDVRGSNDGTWGDDTSTLTLSEGGAIQDPTTDSGTGFLNTSLWQNNGTNIISIRNLSAHAYTMENLYFDWQSNGNDGYLELWVDGTLHGSNTTDSASSSGGDNESSDYADGSIAFLADTVINTGELFTINFVNNGGVAMDMDNIAVVGSIIPPPTGFVMIVK
jgi:hypothetical protein